MKKTILSISVLLIGLLFVGCGSNPTVPDALSNIETSKKFQFKKATLKLEQLINSDIVYHTQQELQDLLNKKLTELLKKNDLLSEDPTMNTLVIDSVYIRRFVGDQTPIPSDALGYPQYSYNIKVIDNGQEIRNYSRDNLTFQGGLVMNLKVIAASLRDKKDEIAFVNVLANTIIHGIKNLKK